MERIHGVIVSDLDELRRRGANIQRLAENGVTIFFTQVLRHNFFHADMHPGNIFVQLDDPEHPKYCAVDFGIVGTLDRARPALPRRELPRVLRPRLPPRRAAARRLGLGAGRHARRRARGRGAHGVRADLQQAAVGDLLRPGAAAAVRDARRFDMKVQPQLILLQKTLLQIEGLGRQLYPELDLWKTAQPVLQGLGVGPPERPQPRRAAAPAVAGPERGAAHAAAGAAAGRAAGLRRQLPHPRRAGGHRGAARRDPRQRPPARRDDRRRGHAARRHRLAGGQLQPVAGRGALRRGLIAIVLARR